MEENLFCPHWLLYVLLSIAFVKRKMDDLPAYHTQELVAVVRRLSTQRLYSYFTLLWGKSRLVLLLSFLFYNGVR